MEVTFLRQLAEVSSSTSSTRPSGLVRARSHAMNKVSALLVVALLVAAATYSVQAQQPSTTPSQPAENVPEVNYHVTVMLPQYRFLDTSGYGGRVGEYDSLQQSLGGDLSFDYVSVPQHMTIRSTWDVINRDDYDMKSRVTFGKWLDFTLDNRSFIRHLDDNSYFGASVISPDIIRIDTVSPDSLLGVRRRMNNAAVKVQLPKVPGKLFVKGGWQARDANSQMQYFDMGGNGTSTDTGCDNCHSASQYRTLNYTTRNIAGGAEVKLGKLMKLVYQHEFRSFNDRMTNPTDIYGLSDPTLFYMFGNPSLHRQWSGLKLAYRLSKQLDLETHYTRMNITRSNSTLWPQFSSPDNTDPLYIVPVTFSNIAGAALHFHSPQLWNARAGYEWTGTHDPGYVTDPHTNHRVFGDITITPASWFTIGNDASVILQQSFPVVQRSNHLYTDTTFVTIKPVPQWSIGGGYTYLQDDLRTDMQLANDGSVGVYTQPLVPYKQLSQTVSIHSTYELKKRLGLNLNVARSLAHSGWRPDLNPADYPNFPGAVSVAGYPSESAFAAAFSGALATGAGPVSQVNVPQTLVAATGNYHLRAGFDGGLRFNYGSYTDNTIWNTSGIRPNVNGKLQSYSVFFGRVW